MFRCSLFITLRYLITMTGARAESIGRIASKRPREFRSSRAFGGKKFERATVGRPLTVLRCFPPPPQRGREDGGGEGIEARGGISRDAMIYHRSPSLPLSPVSPLPFGGPRGLRRTPGEIILPPTLPPPSTRNADRRYFYIPIDLQLSKWH